MQACYGAVRKVQNSPPLDVTTIKLYSVPRWKLPDILTTKLHGESLAIAFGKVAVVPFVSLTVTPVALFTVTEVMDNPSDHTPMLLIVNVMFDTVVALGVAHA